MQIGMIGLGRNGIEYGPMQAYAEGFDILLNARSMDLPEQPRDDLSLRDIAEVWRRGSVVSSWLLDLTAEALVVPADVLSASLFVRFRSRPDHSFERVLSAMRHKFGGHVERPSGG